MNFDVLVPKVSLKSKRRTEILLEQPRELALKERLKQHIYVQSKQYIGRTTTIWSSQQQKEVRLQGLEQDIFSSVLEHSDVLAVSRVAEELASIAKLITLSMINAYQYPQVVVLYRPQFKKYLTDLQLPKDIRYQILPFQEGRAIPFSTIVNVVAINPTQDEIKHLFGLKEKNTNLSLNALLSERNFNISKLFGIGIYRLTDELVAGFQKQLFINNEIYMLELESLYLHMYLSIVAGYRKKKNVVLITNNQRLKDARTFTNNNFVNVQVEDADNLKSLPPETSTVLFEVDKPSFLKTTQDLIFIRTRPLHGQNNIPNMSWTTFDYNSNYQSMFSSAPSVTDTNYNQVEISSIDVFSRIRLKTMQFALGGSFLRFVFNSQDTFVYQDMLIMHFNYPHRKVEQALLSKSPHSMTIIKPKQRALKFLVIINQRLTQTQLSKIQSKLAEEKSCTTISFRECEDLDCLLILPMLAEAPTFNDYMKHYVVTFEFTNQQRYERFISVYLKSLKKNK